MTQVFAFHKILFPSQQALSTYVYTSIVWQNKKKHIFIRPKSSHAYFSYYNRYYYLLVVDLPKKTERKKQVLVVVMMDKCAVDS
jgi:hypothetical protein